MEHTYDNKNSVLKWIGRFIVFAIILMITSFVTPGFYIHGLWTYVIASIVITVIDYIIEGFIGVDARPFGKGIKGFLICFIILYLTQFLVPNMNVTILGALIASVIIGIFDMFLPGRVL